MKRLAGKSKMLNYRELQIMSLATRTGLENVPYHSVRFCVVFLINGIKHLTFYILHSHHAKRYLLAKKVVKARVSALATQACGYKYLKR